MHDPSFLLFDVRPIRLDIWHDEPNGRDAFEVCGHPPQSGLTRIRWAVRHGRHLHYRWWPYLNVKRWIVDRCDHCGRRFLWRDARHSYQSTDKVWHDTCMSLRHVRGQLDDLTGYVLGTADDDARWRANYRLEGLERKESIDDTVALGGGTVSALSFDASSPRPPAEVVLSASGLDQWHKETFEAGLGAGFDLAVAALRDGNRWERFLIRADDVTYASPDNHFAADFLAAVKADVLGTEDTKENGS